jgi:signal transduction histidine kinase
MATTLLTNLSLRSKLMCATALIVMGSCTVLSWYFVDQAITTTAEDAVYEGQLIGHNLAESSRPVVLAGDLERLQQIIEGTLTSERVAYVLITAKDGSLVAAGGSDDWEPFLSDEKHAAQLLLAHEHYSHTGPTVNAGPLAPVVEVRDGEAILSAHLSHRQIGWMSVLTGAAHPFVYHLTTPIEEISTSLAEDPALSLTLFESLTADPSLTGAGTRFYGTVHLGVSSAHEQGFILKLVRQVVIITGLVIIASLLTMMYFTHQMIRPLQALARLTNQVAEGDLSASVTPRSHDEIGQLAAAFNHMTASLKSRQDDLKELNRTLEVRIAARTGELEEANQRLQELDRLKTSLVSTASHELRTPLTSVKILVENLMAGVDGPVTPRHHASLARIDANVERLRRLIDALLDLSRIHTGKVDMHYAQIPLDALMKEVSAGLFPFSQEKRVAIVIDVPPDMPDLWGDRNKLTQVITNLVHNALKFTPAGGTVKIYASAADNTTVIVVSDSGCGIPPEDHEKIFLPFYRSPLTATVTRGSGLGLAIAKELTEMHQGSIEVESRIGQGSRFTIRLKTDRLPAPTS